MRFARLLLVIALATCAKEEPASDLSRVCEARRVENPCPSGNACGSINGYTDKCVPTACAALSNCCTHLSVIGSPERIGCYELVGTAAGAACQTELDRIQNIGHCLVQKGTGSDTFLCDGLGSTCGGYAGSCCAGMVCRIQAGVRTCISCATDGQGCDLDTPCCNGLQCHILGLSKAVNKCVPLRKMGEACSRALSCESWLDCDAGRCVPRSSTPSPGRDGGTGTGGGSSGGGCSSSCNARMCGSAGGYSYCCFWSCSGSTCQQTCTD